MRQDLVLPDAAPDDQPTESALRPSRLDDFVGQSRARELLDIAIEAAKRRGDVLDHILLHGPPGLGKTTLALLLANELGAGIRVLAAPVLEKPGDLVSVLTTLGRGDVLFIDEIHRLPPVVEEFLYPAMEDFRIDIRLAEGAKAESVSLPIEPFTLVGATTRFGMLTPPMRARFGIALRLEYYSVADLARIVLRSAQVIGAKLEPAAAAVIARASRGTPRVANRLLRRVRDHADVLAGGRISQEVAAVALYALGVDENGLDEADLRLLAVMAEHFGGGPVGLGTLATALSEDAGTVEEVYEPFLIQQGLIMRTPRGRVLTEQGRARVQRS